MQTAGEGRAWGRKGEGAPCQGTALVHERASGGRPCQGAALVHDPHVACRVVGRCGLGLFLKGLGAAGGQAAGLWGQGCILAGPLPPGMLVKPAGGLA